MSKAIKVASVIDQVVAEARQARRRQAAEASAVKTASALPVSDIARGLKDLSRDLRAHTVTLAYEDFE